MRKGTRQNRNDRATSALRLVGAMISDVDVWRAANLLLRQHGTDAALAAAQRADEMLAKGDVEGQLVWKRILAAINELQRAGRAENEGVH